MNRFDLIHYRSGYKYQLAEDYTFTTKIHPDKNIDTEFLALNSVCLLTIKKGYAWDGPSGLTIDTKNFMRGSLVHDALYQLIREGFLSELDREQADLELYRICREDGMSRMRAWWVLRGVRIGGGPSAHPEAEKVVWISP